VKSAPIYKPTLIITEAATTPTIASMNPPHDAQQQQVLPSLPSRPQWIAVASSIDCKHLIDTIAPHDGAA